MENEIFNFKTPNFEKLINYGFSLDGDAYFYVTKILDGQFEMQIAVSANGGDVSTKLIDLGTGEPYTLHLVDGASGTFVGAVRGKFNAVLTEIAEKCFEKDVFKSNFAHKVIQYISNKYCDELQFLWKTFPTNAVWRRKDNDKWYGILMVLSKRKLGLDSDEITDIIDLRIAPEKLAEIVDGKKYFAGYHMNKKNWVTVCLDGSVPVEEIYKMIDESYNLAKKG